MPSAGDATWRANRRGIVAMSVAMSMFIVNDTLIKLASESMPASQVIGVRGMIASLWIGAVVIGTGHAGGLAWMVDRRVLNRCALDILGTVSYLLALFALPLATATAINMATPLFITAMAAWWLREAVGWRRWSAVAVGFAGVLFIVRPGVDGLGVWAIVCFLATGVHAFRDIYTRRIPAKAPSIVITFANALAVGLFGCALCLVESWRPMGAREWGLLAAASVFLAIGYHLVVLAMRGGEASVIGAFRYSGLVWAVLLGWAVWGEVPDAPTWAGIVLLISAGLYILHRESVRGRAAKRGGD